ncbi:TraC family protein [Bradyrhizobium sp. Ai1a-2]|uniref:TraC family protein n=1 Tax=Bradyrhizobium sp. Ai1a-2 TaxID=196490 RepID=UPI00040AB0FA|nr:TraC family protein [Bradyrhizobium sp. Ai1a-2]
MKKPSRQIRDEIARLQEQLKQAETREAERIERIALKAGMGEIEIDEDALLSAFEEVAGRFRKGRSRPAKATTAIPPVAPAGLSESGWAIASPSLDYHHCKVCFWTVHSRR